MKIVGLDRVERNISAAAKYLAMDIEADMQDWGNSTVRLARRAHRFGRPYSKGYRGTGNGDRAIQSETDGTSVRVFINPTYVSASSKKYGKFNYIWAQHDGTKRNGKTVIKADPFLTDAVSKNKKNLTKTIRKTISKYLG